MGDTMAHQQESIAARIEAEKQAMVRAFNAGDTAGAIQHQAAFYSLIRARNREPVMVAHRCPVDGLMAVAEGEPCSWCGVVA